MKTEFSSAPWKKVSCLEETLWNFYSAEGQLIGAAYGYTRPGYFPNEKQAETNARLMVAAPTMLNALIAAFEDAASKNNEQLCVQLANAIHEATGENVLGNYDDTESSALEQSLWSLAEWTDVLKQARLRNDKRAMERARLFIVSATDEIVNGEFK